MKVAGFWLDTWSRSRTPKVKYMMYVTCLVCMYLLKPTDARISPKEVMISCTTEYRLGMNFELEIYCPDHEALQSNHMMTQLEHCHGMNWGQGTHCPDHEALQYNHMMTQLELLWGMDDKHIGGNAYDKRVDSFWLLSTRNTVNFPTHFNNLTVIIKDLLATLSAETAVMNDCFTLIKVVISFVTSIVCCTPFFYTLVYYKRRKKHIYAVGSNMSFNYYKLIHKMNAQQKKPKKITRPVNTLTTKPYDATVQVFVIEVLVIMTVLCGLQTAAERVSFMAPPPVCPLKNATFTCTVNDSNHHNSGRRGTTYWQVGNSRPCALPHANPEIVRECGPNDVFEARSQSSHGGYYTSALRVNAHPSLNGTMVRCYVFDGRRGKRTVGRGRLEVIGAPPAPSFLPPNESDIEIFEGSVNVTVRWSEPQDYRHTANITSYEITANCTMPSRRSSWVDTLTVQDSQKMMTFPVGTVATLTVHADVCDSLVGNESKALEFCIEVPPPVPHCSTTAVYNGSSNQLTDIVVTWHQAETTCHQKLMAPGLSSNVRSYTVSVNKQTVEQKYMCTTDSELCSYTWNVADHETVNYTVSVAANNVVGQSVTKNCTSTPIGGLNDLLAVKVHVNSCNNMSINCTFLDSFQGVGYCEIKLSNVDSSFTYCQRSQRRASAGGNVWINNITLNASMIYFYNVSALLEDESTPAIVVQGIITSSPTSRTHIAVESELFMVPPPTRITETATFTCTVFDPMYGGHLATTYWQIGNYPPCDLPHKKSEILKECGPSNAFMARLTPLEGSYYSSTLQVTAHSSLNGTRVRCYVPVPKGEKTVGEGKLEVIDSPTTVPRQFLAITMLCVHLIVVAVSIAVMSVVIFHYHTKKYLSDGGKMKIKENADDGAGKNSRVKTDGFGSSDEDETDGPRNGGSCKVYNRGQRMKSGSDIQQRLPTTPK